MDTLESAVRRAAEVGDLDREAIEHEVALALQAVADDWERGELPASERMALDAVGAPAEIVRGGRVAPRLRGSLDWAQVRATAVPVDAAAERLGVSSSMVRRVIGERPGDGQGLLGVRSEGQRWLVLAYQLPDERGQGGEPGSPQGRRVQRNLPPRMHPLAVRAWWETPNDGLFVEDRVLTPREWLAKGLDGAYLVEVAQHEDAD